jgi:hypothetical protein
MAASSTGTLSQTISPTSLVLFPNSSGLATVNLTSLGSVNATSQISASIPNLASQPPSQTLTIQAPNPNLPSSANSGIAITDPATLVNQDLSNPTIYTHEIPSGTQDSGTQGNAVTILVTVKNASNQIIPNSPVTVTMTTTSGSFVLLDIISNRFKASQSAPVSLTSTPNDQGESVFNITSSSAGSVILSFTLDQGITPTPPSVTIRSIAPNF